MTPTNHCEHLIRWRACFTRRVSNDTYNHCEHLIRWRACFTRRVSNDTYQPLWTFDQVTCLFHKESQQWHLPTTMSIWSGDALVSQGESVMTPTNHCDITKGFCRLIVMTHFIKRCSKIALLTGYMKNINFWYWINMLALTNQYYSWWLTVWRPFINIFSVSFQTWVKQNNRASIPSSS